MPKSAPGMVRAISGLTKVHCILFVAPHLAVSCLENKFVFANTLNVIALPTGASFCNLQSRIHGGLGALLRVLNERRPALHAL